ncbi:MAG: sigma 54-interacting transcriptional regulator [Thermodesulfobacteriota bacterium]
MKRSEGAISAPGAEYGVDENNEAYPEGGNGINELEILNHLAQGTASVVGANFFNSLVQHLASAMKVRYAFIAQCTDSTMTRVRTLSFWLDDRFGENIEFELRGTPCENVIAGSVCVYPERLQSLFPEDAGLVDMNAQSYLGIPIRDTWENVLGHIAVIDDKPMTQEPLGINVLQIFASRAGAEIERKRAEDSLRENYMVLAKKNRYETIIGNVTRLVHQSLKPEEVFENAVEALSKNIEMVNCAGIYLIEGDEAVLKAQRGYPVKYLEFTSRIPRPKGFTWETIQKGEPSYCPDIDAVEAASVARRAGVKSFLCVPIRSRGEVIGTLDITSFHKDAFDEDELKLLEIVSRQIETAVNNARQADELKESQISLRKALAEVEELKNRLQIENVYLREEINTENNFEEIVGRSDEIKRVLRSVEQVARTGTTVLIHGETGTGKELVARAIHNLSDRRQRTLVKVNCGAISAGLVESELFGHEKGAFTGALQKRVGRFELADGGTVFLDEVGELPADVQVKLLRVLQEGEFERVGSSETIKVDVRVIAATNRDLEEAVRDKSFRSDLFYRLNIFPINVPPLRERKSDIPLLANFFLTKFSKKLGRDFTGFSKGTIDSLLDYSWPGNIRELQNIVERAVVISNSPEIDIDDSILGGGSVSQDYPSDENKSLEDVERSHILNVLEESGWVIDGKKGAAAVLNINPNTLRSRMKKLGIKKPERAARGL